uniref:Uncharacterized protein n=1 Tax=Glossina pallidipes TaxID=7398 RepID=A0A1A9ZJ35_GLOPL
MTKKTRQRPKLCKPTRKQTEYDAKLNLLTDYIFNNLSKGKNEKYTKREYSYKDDLFNTEETSTVKKPETPLIDKKVDGRNYIATDPETKTTKQMSGNIMPPLIGSGPQILNVTKAYILKLTNYAIIQGMLEKAKWNYKPK